MESKSNKITHEIYDNNKKAKELLQFKQKLLVEIENLKTKQL